MKFKLLLLLLLAQISAFGQHFIPMNFDTLIEPKQELILTGIGDASSTALGFDIANKFLFGGEITSEMKDKSLERHRSMNRFGSDANIEIEYRNYKAKLFKSEQFGFLVKAGMYNFNQLIYSKDVFQLAMYGNEDFLGDTANLSGTQFKSTTFQKIGFGFIDKFSKSSITLNLVGLNNATSINLDRMELYQSAGADTLKLAYTGDYNFYENAAFLKGIGVALDFDIRFNSMNKKGDAVYFQVLGRNLGFVSSISSQSTFSSNSQVAYTGFSYDEISNGGSIINDNVALMDSLGIDESTTKKSEFLPGLLQASKLVDVNSKRKLQEFYGGRMYLSKIAIPQIFGGLNYHPIDFLNIGASATYGGFSGLRGGAYLSYNTSKLNIGISSENLFSKIGVSYLIRLQCAF
jgi:hypothetical protein